MSSSDAQHISERVSEGRQRVHRQRADAVVAALLVIAGGPMVNEAHRKWGESRSTARYIVNPEGTITYAEGGWYTRPEVGGVSRFVPSSLKVWDSWPEFARARDWLQDHPGETTVSYTSNAEGLGTWFVTVTRLSEGHFGVACKLLDHTHIGGPDAPSDAR